MPDLLRIGLSALLAHQRALATTSHNIANASTPGYSKQRVELTEGPYERYGTYTLGTGVQVGGVRRLGDDVIAEQLRSAYAGFHRADAFAELAAGIDNLFADGQSGLNATLQSFVNAFQELASDPSSSSVRQVLLGEAHNVASRFAAMDQRLGQLNSEVAARLEAATIEINALGAGLAQVNRQIVDAGVATGRPAPPDLLDQRDRLLADLAKLVQVEAVQQSDGSTAVFIGSGQTLVLGGDAATLAVLPGTLDPGQPRIVMRGTGTDLDLTRFLSGGELGGLLDFNREMLAPTRAELGRIAVGIVDAVNTAHRNGMDLLGQLGGNLLGIGAPQAVANDTNAGSGALAVTIADIGALQAANYELSYDGTDYALLRTDNGTVVPLTGTGTAGDPLVAEGLSIVVSGTPAAGDSFSVKALEHVAGTLSVLISNPARLAAAAPIRTVTAAANTGMATISAGEVADVTHASLLSTSTIRFLTPSTYSVNGAGSFAYTSGNDIVLNGARVRITGVPAAGDEFVIESNAGGVGDNRNALAISTALGAGIFNGGSLSLHGAVGGLVTGIGARTAETANQRDAQDVLADQTSQHLDSIRGVNLDEEAADLLKFQQMYQAAAQTMAIADSLFDTLLSALRR